jgi:hypothetical protein
MRLLLVIVGICFAATSYGAHPCEQVVDACAAAGFVKKEAKAGYGITVDCIRPLMQGKAQPPKAVKPLPAMNPQLAQAISDCKAKRPNFGER